MFPTIFHICHHFPIFPSFSNHFPIIFPSQLTAGPHQEGSQPSETVNSLEVVLRLNLAQALIKLMPGQPGFSCF
jgi:hypothetical protein